MAVARWPPFASQSRTASCQETLACDQLAQSEPEPFVAHPPESVDLDDFGAVVFTAGYRPDYASWVDFPVFDDLGFPVTADDLTTAVPGLYFCGVHFLRTRKSSLLFGVGDDADIVVASILAAAP